MSEVTSVSFPHARTLARCLPRPPRDLPWQAKPAEFIAGTDGCDIWEVDRDPRVLVEGHEEDIFHVAVHPTDPAEFATACGSGQVGSLPQLLPLLAAFLLLSTAK